jgi:hypothetical protein
MYTSELNKESTPVPTTDDFGLSMHVTVQRNRLLFK